MLLDEFNSATTFGQHPIMAWYFNDVPAPKSWASRALGRLTELQNLQNGWDGYGSDAPNPVSVYWAHAAVRRLVELNLEPGAIAPSVEGGIGFTFANGDRRVVIEFCNDGDIVCLTAINGSPPNIRIGIATRCELDRTLSFVETFLDDNARTVEDQFSSSKPTFWRLRAVVSPDQSGVVAAKPGIPLPVGSIANLLSGT